MERPPLNLNKVYYIFPTQTRSDYTDKLPKITSAFLNVTNACNLACRYCFVEQHPNYMTFDVAKDAAEFLYRNAVEGGTTAGITFFGGEPMICWDTVVKPLIEYIRVKRALPFTLSMTTNGTLLTSNILEYLKANNVGLLFSIDGNRETQDYNRPCHGGGSSFDALAPLIPIIIKHYPDMTFRSTLVPDTCHHLFENIQFAAGLGYQNFFVIPNVFQEWDKTHRKIVEAGFRKYSDFFIGECMNGHIPIRCNPLEDGFRRILEINNAISGNLCQGCNTAYQKCGLGATAFGSVDYKGNLYACQEMVSCKGKGDPFYIGNIYDGTDTGARNALISEFDAKRLSGEDCAACRLRRVCDGGCVANNYMWGGSVNAVPPDYCWWIRLMLDEAIYIMNVLGDAKCPSFCEYWAMIQQTGGGRCPNMLNK